MADVNGAGLDRAQLRTIVEQARIPLAASDASGCITMLSPALEELFEQSFERVEESQFPARFRLHASDGRTPLRPEEVPLTRARHGETVIDAVVSTRKADGRMVFLRCNAAPIRGDDGQIAGAVVMVQDITAERAAEDEQRELRERLVMTINHEFRTPLTKLFGHAEILVDVEETLPENVRHSVRTIRRATEELASLLRTISQLIDLESHTRLEKQYADLAALLREVAVDFAETHEGPALRLVTDIPDRLAATIDPLETRRAVWELLKNAVTYGPDDGAIELSGGGDSATIWIHVGDHGQGIPAGERARLMEPFERGDHARQPVNSKGLGLAIAHAVAAAHGGRLELADREPHGLRASLTMQRFGTPSGARKASSP